MFFRVLPITMLNISHSQKKIETEKMRKSLKFKLIMGQQINSMYIRVTLKIKDQEFH